MTAERRVTLTLVSEGRGAQNLPAVAREAARAGVDQLQVREKQLSARALRELVTRVVAAVSGTDTSVFVNGRPDIALVAGAHGVQLPEAGLPVADVKRAFPGLRIGASCHSVEGALGAEGGGADFVVLGPIFATPGKPRAAGTEVLGEAARRLRIPVHAIGGIDLRTAPQALAAGAGGLMAIRLFLTGSLAATVRSLRSLE